MSIPQYEPLITDKDRQSVIDYIKKDIWLTEFVETRKLEKSIANFLGVKYCSIVNNGTISLSLALLAGGIKAGDKVIIPNLTMIATATAVSLIGAIPILVDVNISDLTLDYNSVIDVLEKEKNIKALIYVTLNGRGQYIYDFKELCKANNIFYISDDAQSLGSLTNKKEKIGNVADISSFSFSMPKIITTGQGGCLVTNDDYYYKKIIELRDFGRDKAGVDNHPYYGINSKFTDLQAVIGNSQMDDIYIRIEQKKNIYYQYQYLLGNIPEVEFLPTSLTYTTPWFVDIYIDNKEKLIEFLKKEGIGTRPIYPPIHTQGIYKNDWEVRKLYPISEQYSKKGLWLPSSLTLTKDKINFICDKIQQFYMKD